MQFVDTERIVNGYNVFIHDDMPLTVLMQQLDFAYSLTNLYKDNAKFAPIVNFITTTQRHQQLVDSYQPKLSYGEKINRELVECAIAFYGITDSSEKAGYMLRNGTMLDFSGSNMMISLFDTNHQGSCNLSHDTFFGINNNNYQLLADYPCIMTKPCPIAQFIKATGAIRMTATNKDRFIAYIDLPSKQQLSKIYDIYRDNWLIIEHIDQYGNTIDDVEFTKLTKNNLNWVYSH